MVASNASYGGFATLVVVCSLAGGCTLLPDTSGYTAATIQVKQAIEQIVDAGNQGTASARQVADAVKNLVDAVRVDALTGASATAVALSADRWPSSMASIAST
jgi:hypothetical protein